MISLRDTAILLRFIAIGVVNTCFGISIYWLLLYIDIPYQWATLFSLVLSIIFSFNSHKLAVFKTKGGFFRYVLVWVGIYFFNIEIISIIRVYIGDYYAAVALLPVNATLSFLLLKRFVFQLNKGYGIV